MNMLAFFHSHMASHIPFFYCSDFKVENINEVGVKAFKIQ
jgi:hypothetical protein